MGKLETRIKEVIQASKHGYTKKQIEKALGLSTSADFAILSKTLDHMEDHYELLRQKGNVYTVPDEKDYVTHTIHISRAGTGYIDLEKETILVDSRDTLDAMDGDTVIVNINKYREGKVVAVKERAHTFYTGTYVRQGRTLKCILDDAKAREYDAIVKSDSSFTPVEGMKVLLSVLSYGKPLKLHVERSIGHKDDPGMDILTILYANDIIPEFPEEVLQEAQAIPQVVQETDKVGRQDLTEIQTITIDGDDSKDFDDAISIEKTKDGWNLKVSIADVSYYVKEGSALDKEAWKRGTSTYVVDWVVPMLPHLLSNGICSLNPEEERLTITCDMNVRKDGTIQSYQLYPSYICSTKRMTYKKVNAFLDGDKEVYQEYEMFGELLHDLANCADAIRSYRHDKGAIDFDTEEALITVNENGYPTNVSIRERGHGERMIEDCMIAANVCVANFLQTHDIPGIYRVHGSPEAKKLKGFQTIAKLLGQPLIIKNSTVRAKELQEYLEQAHENENFSILAHLLLRCMQKATYEDTCIGHYGIAEKEYLHFTSPIRRYPDLVVHRMLRKYYFEKQGNQSYGEDLAFVKEAALQSSNRERASVNAERDVEDYKKTEFMQDKVGMNYHGVITSVVRNGFYVEIQDTIEGFVNAQSLTDDYYSYVEDAYALVGLHSKKRYTVGDKVEVQLVGTNLETRTIQFELPNQKEKKQNKQSKHQTRSRASKYAERSGNIRGKRRNGRRKK